CRGRVSSVEHVIGVAGPELGNFRGGLVASATSASFSLASGGLSAVLAIAAVYATNAPLRAYRTPAAPEEPSAPKSLAPAQAATD
ncbi:MFS transporter, partial [Streptomyces anulatus]